MALIHWWPLTENTTDKIKGLELTSSTSSLFVRGGKVGNCYSSSAAGHTLRSSLNIPNTFSFACWVKNNNLTYPRTTLPLVFGSGAVYQQGVHGWDFAHGANGEAGRQNYRFTLNDGVLAPQGFYWSLDLLNPPKLLNSWYHIAVTVNYERKKVNLYINGTSLGEQNMASNLGDYGGVRPFTLGNLSGWWLDGYVNDFRLYNHALSQKEVYDLSKALVAHYTFNDILADGTENIFYNKIKGYNSAWEELLGEKHLGLPIYRNTVTYLWQEGMTGRDNAGFYCEKAFDYLLEANPKQKYFQLSFWKRLIQPYTTSFWGYLRVVHEDETHTDIQWVLDNSSQSNWMKDENSLGKWEFITLKAKVPENKKIKQIRYMYYYGRNASQGVCDFSGIQIELKDHPTPYANGTRVPMLRNEAGYDKPLTNALALTTDTNSGQYAMVFDPNKPTYIKTPLDIVGDTDVSVAYWLYPRGGAAFAGNILYNVMAAGIDSSHLSVSLYAYGRSTKWLYSSGNCLKRNEWNHVVVTYSKDKRTLYVNGKKNCEDEISGTFESRPNGNTLDIGADSSTVRVFDGKMSDIRIYRSCLTEEDVENLYLTKGSIDNQNQIGTNLFVENCENVLFSNKYVLESNEIYEDIGDYERLEFLESSGAQYIDTGYIAKSKSFTYEIDFESNTTGAFDSFIGFMNPSNNTIRAGIHYYSNTIMFGAANTINSSVPWTKNERMILKGDFTSGAQKLYKNDILIAQTTTSTAALGNNELSTYIFARNCSSSMNYAEIKLYSAKIYEGKTLVRYYIPVRRAIDQKPGLYDLINKTFTTNGGAGADFTCGTILAHEQASIYTNARVSAAGFVEV